MNIIITMAGIGKRFRDAGYTMPKYMIKAKGKTLFEWSMDSLLGYNEHVNKYIFTVRNEDNAEKFISDKVSQYKISTDIMCIDRQTDGQATTCMLALSHCDENDSIMVYNIDTYIEPYELKYEDISGDGYIPCFHALGDHWSFVRTDCDNNVVEVREKERISNNCSIGAYYFSSARIYKKIYNDYYSYEINKNKEKYIAPLYNQMIKDGLKVNYSIVNEEKVHVLGTPQELEIFLNE